MARTVTLGQLRDDVADLADILGAVGALQRYTPTRLNRRINQSIQRFRENLSTEGSTHFLTSTSGNFSVGATSPYPFQTLDLSAVSPSIVRVAGIDVEYNNRVYTLKHVPFNDRDQFGGPLNTDFPTSWAQFQTDKLAILPPPDGQYGYVVWYLPVLADLSSDSDTFNGVAGWEEFIVWDVLLYVIIKDQYPQAYQMAVDQSERRWRDILRSATKVSSAGGAVTGRDSFGDRLNQRIRRNVGGPGTWG